jgi:hypothetical protein
MFGPERYAEIFEDFHDNQEWLSQLFGTMARQEFHDFIDFCLERLNHDYETKSGPESFAEYRRVKGLLFAIARKELELSDFGDGLTIEQRLSTKAAATSYHELAKGFYAPHQQDAVDAAWQASLDRGEKFGYRSGPVFEILAPHHVFRDHS